MKSKQENVTIQTGNLKGKYCAGIYFVSTVQVVDVHNIGIAWVPMQHQLITVGL